MSYIIITRYLNNLKESTFYLVSKLMDFLYSLWSKLTDII